MLILTRRAGETIMIGDNISVTVLGVMGSQVRIGVNAPAEVTVDREEVHVRRKEGWPDRPKQPTITLKPSVSKG